MKKTKLLTFFFAFLSFGIYAENDYSLFCEVNSAFASGAYPQAVESASDLYKKYSSSSYVPRALLMEGKSLFVLGRYSDAEKILKETVARTSGNDELQVQAYYYLGRTQHILRKSDDALENFYRAYSLNSEHGSASLYYAGQIYFEKSEFKKSAKVFENVISRGNEFNENDYSTSFRLLFEIYLNSNQNSRLINVYKKIPDEAKENHSSLYSQLTLHAGTAYENLKKYKDAYDCYIKVLEGNDSVLASLGLQKAYLVASNHKKEIEEEPGAVLENAKSNLYEYSDLLAEFWTRLGIDAYDEKKFEQAKKYFDEAEKSDRENVYAALIGLYKSEMSDDKLSMLKSYEQKGNVDSENELGVFYEIQKAKIYAELRDWENCLLHAKNAESKISNSKNSGQQNYKRSVYEEIILYQALSYYSMNDAGRCLEILESAENKKFFENSKTEKLLYANCLSMKGRHEEALGVYECLAENKLLSSSEKNDYAKVLFLNGLIGKCYENASESDDKSASYMKGISSFNRKDWKNAEENLLAYLNSEPDSKTKPYAQFYLGYSQYKRGEYRLCEKTLSDFISKNEKHPLIWNSCITASNASLSNKEYEKAASYAQQAIDFSMNQIQKENSVLLCATCFSDSEDYDSAISVLKPYTKSRKDFGARARYESALIYKNCGKIEESNRMFEEIMNYFPTSSIADESAYQRGELYYSTKNYSQAVSKFNEYKRKFPAPTGQFIEGAYFYSAESYFKTNQLNAAVLEYELLVSEFPTSSYAKSAKDRLAEISRIQSVGSSKSDKLRFEYENDGKSNTAEGRAKGTDLAEALFESDATKKDGFILASELLEIQSASQNIESECGYAARTSLICARYSRSINDLKESASKFLEAAKYGKMSGQEEIVQRSLYGAAEAFDAAGLYGDSRAAAKNLIESYPNGKYAKQAKEWAGE